MQNPNTPLSNLPQNVPTLDELPGLKSGWRTSEFWITLAAYAAGTVLIARGQDFMGGILMSVATGGFQLARGLAKHGENAAVQGG